MTKSFLALATVILTLATSQAKITWDESEKSISLDPATPKVSVTFRGVNDDKPVTIVKIDKSCGCTSVTPTRTKLEKGNDVVLQTEINLPASGGKQVKTVTVKTDDNEETRLKINIDMPENFTLSKSALLWEKDAVNPLSFFITFPEKSPMKFSALSSLSPIYKTEAKEVPGSNGSKYELIVTPTTPNPPRSAVRIDLTGAENRPVYIGVESLAPKPTPTPAPVIPAPAPQAAQAAPQAAAPQKTAGNPTVVEKLKAIQIQQRALLQQVEDALNEAQK